VGKDPSSSFKVGSSEKHREDFRHLAGGRGIRKERTFALIARIHTLSRLFAFIDRLVRQRLDWVDRLSVKRNGWVAAKSGPTVVKGLVYLFLKLAKYRSEEAADSG
jgi:hypothetical protein